MPIWGPRHLPLLGQSFNATTSDINLGASSAQDCLAQTALALCYPTGAGEGNAGYIFALTTSATSNGPRFVHLDNSGNPQFGLQCNSSGTAGAPVHNSDSNTAPYNNWYHVAGTWDGGINADGVQVYIGQNGATLANRTTNGANFVNGTGSGSVTAGRNLHIGNREGTDRTFNGIIAYVARWNRVLSFEELVLAQQRGPLAVPKGLILCWANDRDYGPYKLKPSSRTAITQPTNLPQGIAQFTVPGTWVGMGSTASVVSSSAAGARRARGADTAAKTSANAAAGRVRARGSAAAAPASAITTSAAGRLRARGVAGSIRRIVFDAASATTTVDPSTITYTYLPATGAYQITVDPRRTYAENNDNSDHIGWRTAHFKATGINGAKVVIKINRYLSDTPGTASNYVKPPWASTDKGCYSYDRTTWTYFDTASSRDPTTTDQVTLTHSGSFSQDAVWFSKYPRIGTADALSWIQALAATYPTLVGNVTGGSSYSAGTYSAQTDELGRTVAASPLLAFTISDSSLAAPSGQKKVAVFYGGVHATEEGGDLALRKAIEFVCGSDPKALTFRRYFDLIVFPLVNAPGRNGGHYRTQFQSTANGTPSAGADLQWHYTDASPDFDTVRLSRAAAVTALAGRRPDLFIDWHSKYNGTYGAYTWGYGSVKLLALIQSYVTTGTDGANVTGVTQDYFRNTQGALASLTAENVNQDGAGTDSDVTLWGESWIKASVDWLNAGGFSVDPVGRRRARGAGTGAKISSAPAAGRVRSRGATSAAPSGAVSASASGRRRTRGASAAVKTSTVSDTGRLRTRGAVTAGSSLHPTSAAGRARARGAAATAPLRLAGSIGRLRARGAIDHTSTVAPVFADTPDNIPRVGLGTMKDRDRRVGSATLSGGSGRIGGKRLR